MDRKRIRVRITAVAVLLLLVCAGLLMFASYRRTSRSISDQLEVNYGIAAEKYAQELTAWINTNATIIEALAAEITESGVDLGDAGDFHGFLAENCRLLNGNGYIFDIYYTYPDNRMVCASDFVADGSVDYVHDREWFSRAAGTGELFYSTPYRDSDSGKPIITISRAVYRDNVLQGVLAADIFVDVLVDIISRADVAEDSYAFLVDQNLGMIVHPDPAYAFDDVPQGVMDVPGAPYGDVITQMRSDQRETVYVKDYDGVERGIVSCRMENTGWYVGIATSRDVLVRGMNSLLRGFLIATATAIVIGVILATILAFILERWNRPAAVNAAAAKRETRAGEAHDGAKKKESAGEELPRRSNQLVPILLILLLMIAMIGFTSRIIWNVAVANVRDAGEDRISGAAAQLENYLETARGTLWVTADTVDHMVRGGAGPEAVLDYITEETENQKEHFDVNITGLYGVISGVYLDGLAWEPPENYDPTRREWYLAAIEAQGETVVVSPYLDAQTDGVIISICRMLSNGSDVISIDIQMDHIQELVSELKIQGKGYGFIVSEDGMVIAHDQESMKGRFLTENEEQLALLDGILETKDGMFEFSSGPEKTTVFVHQILDQWYVAIVINSRELFSEVRQQLTVNILICAAIFALVLLFYMLGRRNERSYSRRIEEMRVEEQKKAYEAKALKLEKEAADRANLAKSGFLADMSHEIRTPINAVLGMNEMILRESLRAPGTQEPRQEAFENIAGYARNIESAGHNLLAIINDILDFSKIEAGRMEIVEAPYDLSSVLNDVSNMILFKARDKGLEFTVDVDGTIPDNLCGDVVRVRQILTNVLSNAVKYTEHGSVRLTLRGEKREDGRTVELRAEVEDTGIGIRPEDSEKLFTKFERLDLQQNSTVEGTGLGLAITHRLLEMMGGTISVESEYGKGSVFTVTVPQKIVSPEPIGDFRTRWRAYAQEQKAYSESFRAPEARILVVDDTKMNLTVAVGLLRNTLLHIDTAMSGEEAIEMAASTAYDVILMDQRMPKMDRTEALHRIRALEESPNADTPVICLTADAIIGAKERYIAEGFTDYLTKPVDGWALEQMLMRYLPQEKVERLRGESAPAPEAPAPKPDDGLAPLREAGIDTETGLRYCQNDADFYRTVLAEYALGEPEKSGGLRRFFDAEDWKNYAVLVHALKSSSKMIGAQALSETAAALEQAANASDAEAVRASHGEMLSAYGKTASAIRAALPAAEPQDASDDDVLEFAPEE